MLALQLRELSYCAFRELRILIKIFRLNPPTILALSNKDSGFELRILEKAAPKMSICSPIPEHKLSILRSSCTNQLFGKQIFHRKDLKLSLWICLP